MLLLHIAKKCTVFKVFDRTYLERRKLKFLGVTRKSEGREVDEGIWWENLEARGHFEKPRRRSKCNFKVNFKDISWE
jgi:hypothetical protein